MGVPDTVRHQADQVIFEEYAELGYNYRMTDIQAAVGREQLKRLPQILARRREQVARYRQQLARVPGLVLPCEPAWARSNWQSFCVRLPAHCDQRGVMQQLLDAGIASRRGIMCAHREPAYRMETWGCGQGPGACGCPPGACRQLAAGEEAQDRTIVLPLYDQMTDDEQDRVVAALYEVCAT
jgi:dTDP-4-amino-4,6-dideoxygalactose transaminase